VALVHPPASKQTALDQGQTDCISLTLDLELTYNLDLQSLASYGHDLLTRKSQQSVGSEDSGNKQTDGQV